MQPYYEKSEIKGITTSRARLHDPCPHNMNSPVDFKGPTQLGYVNECCTAGLGMLLWEES